MALELGDSLTAHNFGLQIDGVMVDTLSEVSDLTYEQEVITYKQNTPDGAAITRNMPGTAQSGTCTVVYGANPSKEFKDWQEKSREGDMGSARKNATIIIMDYQRNPVKRYHLRNAWCSSISLSNLKAGEASPLTETVTITFEELVIE